MSNIFSERGYPDSIITKALTRVQNVDRESALKQSLTMKKEFLSYLLSTRGSKKLQNFRNSNDFP